MIGGYTTWMPGESSGIWSFILGFTGNKPVCAQFLDMPICTNSSLVSVPIARDVGLYIATDGESGDSKTIDIF